MLHYIDIRLLPDPEFPRHQLMGTLYTKLHQLFVQRQVNTIGVSFPEYQVSPPSLGSTLRLLGPESDLNELMQNWSLQGMQDHTEVMQIERIPINAVYRPLRRVQVKNPERLIRRQMRRHGLTEQEVRERITSCRVCKLMKLPYVVLSSKSTGQRFPLFLKLEDMTVREKAEEWVFNSYGLSNTTAIPCF